MQIFLGILYLLVCVLLVGLILSQKKKITGIGNAMTGNNTDTYWSQNKGRSTEGKKVFYTKIVFVVYFVLSISISFYALKTAPKATATPSTKAVATTGTATSSTSAPASPGSTTLSIPLNPSASAVASPQVSITTNGSSTAPKVSISTVTGASPTATASPSK